MPAIADLVIKKADETTNITFTGVQPSSGDGSAAIWKSQSVGTAPNHQPEARVSGREASNGAKRAIKATLLYPQIATNTTTGVTSVVDRALFSGEWTVPKGMAQADINEFAHQTANFVAAALMKSIVKSGYSAS